MKQTFFISTGIRVVARLLLLLIPFSAVAQKSDDVYVDKNGVMRWGRTNKEVQGFGVNYTVPFAHAYRSANKLNVDHKKAIDDDVYHFARLGFDAFRVHVWDTEISDSVGNLLDNEHLRLFDYSLMRMKERGIKILLTPIAFWGNGYPEPDEKTPGFAAKYGKDDCLVNEEAIKAQERYLFQFLNHVNPYTKVAYKDDPDIVAFEVSNEPHHKGTPEEVTAFIQRMVKSMRNTGCKKPIFYNVSHSIHLYEAYYKAGIQGGTFQWYPTGLGARHELRGNFLPNVDRYVIPFGNDPQFKKGAKVVYEFDAADVGRSYIYPAMARSFREAGIQWATHFSYDPTYMAYANTEYNTHYMNLVYTPSKALSLKIASEVFHRVPMYKSFGRFPDNNTFDAFYVNYENDLAEMVTDTKFIYTNSTATKPPRQDKLEEISGFGNSTIIQYDGLGAYFLDRVKDGVWRLEVMPDAIWIDNPFGRNSLEKTLAVVNWRKWNITINLPGLGEGFQIKPLNDEKNFRGSSNGTTFEVTPGTYLLTRKGITSALTGKEKLRNITLEEFVAPLSTVDKTKVLHIPHNEVNADHPVTVTAIVVSREVPESVKLFTGNGWRMEGTEMKRISGYTYQGVIMENNVKEGYLRYYIGVTEKGNTISFPSGESTVPGWRNANDSEFYQVAVLKNARQLFLFNAHQDTDELSRPWRGPSPLVPTGEPAKSELLVKIEKLSIPDPEDKHGEQVYDYSMRYHFGKKISGRSQELGDFKKLVVRGRSLAGKSTKIQVGLISKSGAVMSGMITLDEQRREYALDLNAFVNSKMVILPRPYPSFLPYYIDSSNVQFNFNDIEVIQISVGPGMDEKERASSWEIAIQDIWLE